MPETIHILIVDDDERICRLLRRYLEAEGYSVDTAHDGDEMWAKIEQQPPNLIVLDLVLPGKDGITLARELRATTRIGIIMLTGKKNPVDTVVGLEVGADDYVTKPFDSRELLARIRSVLRRSSETAGEDESPGGVLEFDGWKMSLDSYQLTSPKGEPARLTAHEFKLLEILVNNPNHVLSRDQILQKLSHRDWQPDDRSVDVLIGKLRKVIEVRPSEPKLIRTVRSVGYQFTGKVRKL